MLFDFILEIVFICNVDWKICGIFVDLEDCCVEIIGLVECKMVINVFNVNVKVFMVDFEDLLVLDWNKVIDG